MDSQHHQADDVSCMLRDAREDGIPQELLNTILSMRHRELMVLIDMNDNKIIYLERLTEISRAIIRSYECSLD